MIINVNVFNVNLYILEEVCKSKNINLKIVKKENYSEVDLVHPTMSVQQLTDVYNSEYLVFVKK